MKRGATALLVLWLPLSAAVDERQVQEILQKFRVLATAAPSAEVGFEIYDPFKKIEPMIKKAKPVRRFTPPPSRPRLMAVMAGAAFIDRRWVKEGERVKGWRVVKIEREGVVLQKGKKRLVLRVGGTKRYLKVKDGGR